MQSFVALLSLSALVAAAPTAEPAPLRVALPDRKLTKRADGVLDPVAFFTNLNNTLLKYGASPLQPIAGLEQAQSKGLLGLAKRQSNEKLTDQAEDGIDELYYGSGQVGSQTFTFDFDTGSSDIFIPGPQCGPSQGCPDGRTKYNQGGTDRHSQTSVTYGSGAVSGENYYDTVTVAGLAASQQNVISLSQAQGFATSQSDGLMGMGFSTIAQSKSPTYFETLIAQKKVSTQEFSFYLGRAKSNTGANSEMTLGGRDSSKFTGAVTKVPVTKKGYWQVAIDGTSANGNKALLSGGQAAIDTGTTLVLGPTAAVLPLFAEIPGAVPLTIPSGSLPITLFVYPCNSKPKVDLIFAGKSFAINDLDFNAGQLTPAILPFLAGLPLPESLLGLLTEGGCLAGVGAADINPTSPLYIVGDTFLKNWYSIYNYEGSASVSFAKGV